MDSIILAGGFGKRLKPEIKDIPKPLAPINGRPFLDYLFEYLMCHGMHSVILSVFFKHELIKENYNEKYKSIDISYSIDKSEYGTGGAIKSALPYANTENVLVINGDTFFDISLFELIQHHRKKNNQITIALKEMHNFDRYGYVEFNSEERVIGFKEKTFCEKGHIDGGIYLIKKSLFAPFEVKKKFSFNGFLMENIKDLKIGCKIFKDPFVDIGIPDDYRRAQEILGVKD